MKRHSPKINNSNDTSSKKFEQLKTIILINNTNLSNNSKMKEKQIKN